MTSLLPEEQKAIILKYKSKPFGQMDAKALNVAAYALLMKIQVITGWNIPDEPNDDILVEQLRLKCQESYALVNPDEMEYAMRIYGTTIEDWGKPINLSLIDKAMTPYLSKRAELSKIEEQKTPLMIEHKEDMSDKAMQEWMEETRRLIKNGQAVDFTPVGLYEWAVKTALIKPTPTEKREALGKAVAHREARLADESTIREDTNDSHAAVVAKSALSKFMEMKEAGYFEGEERERLVNLSKRILLYEHLR